MEQDSIKELLEAIQDAEMILVGLGEEFDTIAGFQNTDKYEEGKNILIQSKKSSYVPAWQSLYREQQQDLVTERLTTLAKVLEGKNYFVVSVATNNAIAEIPWREGRLVMPCGSDMYRQCSPECEENLKILDSEEQLQVKNELINWRKLLVSGKTDSLPECLGSCSKCKAQIELNNIYSEQYDENGYLPAWQFYTKWLQGTLNRKLVILELGVGMKFPSVIRFPFEKVAYFNQKAKFYRINKNLYHLTEELAGKGVGIADNAIDWLGNLC